MKSLKTIIEKTLAEVESICFENETQLMRGLKPLFDSLGCQMPFQVDDVDEDETTRVSYIAQTNQYDVYAVACNQKLEALHLYQLNTDFLEMGAWRQMGAWRWISNNQIQVEKATDESENMLK